MSGSSIDFDTEVIVFGETNELVRRDQDRLKEEAETDIPGEVRDSLDSLNLPQKGYELKKREDLLRQELLDLESQIVHHK